MADGSASPNHPFPHGTGPAETAARGASSHGMALAAICISYAMIFLDITVVNVALSAIHRDLHAGIAGLQWSVDGYALVFASFLLTAGAIGDRFGSKRIMVIGLVVFALASAMCGLAPTLGMLLAARALQGIGAALQLPATLALLTKTFPESRERVRAIVITMLAANVALAGGPMVGGLLISTVGWRAVFLLNVPAGALAIVFALAGLIGDAPAEKRGLDLPGQFLAIVALGSLTFALIEGRSWGFVSPVILALFAAAAGSAIAFILVERHQRQPMVPLPLFNNPTFSAATANALLLNFVYYGLLFMFSLYFPMVRHDNAWQTGLSFFPMTGTLVVGNLLSGRLITRFGSRLPMALGMALCAVGSLGLLAVEKKTSFLVLLPLLMCLGFGGALNITAMVAAVLGTVKPAEAGIATGIVNCSRQIGGVIGVAVLGALTETARGFLFGLHVAAVLVGVSAVAGALLALRFVAVPEHADALAVAENVALEP